MKRNFYLQHPLMAMHDPRMQNLLAKETLKGTGAYWFIIENWSYCRVACSDPASSVRLHKISFVISRKSFLIEEDGYFTSEAPHPYASAAAERKIAPTLVGLRRFRVKMALAQISSGSATFGRYMAQSALWSEQNRLSLSAHQILPYTPAISHSFDYFFCFSLGMFCFHKQRHVNFFDTNFPFLHQTYINTILLTPKNRINLSS